MLSVDGASKPIQHVARGLAMLRMQPSCSLKLLILLSHLAGRQIAPIYDKLSLDHPQVGGPLEQSI